MVRFPSPLIEPDVPISGIRLSDWLHRMTHGCLSPASVLHGGGPKLGLRRAIELPLKDPDLSGVARLIANHPILSVVESAPEVRGLPSPGVTRLHRYYVPVRLPPQPPPRGSVEVATPAATDLPHFTDHLPDVPCPLPRWIERVYVSILPRPHGLPRYAGGSASTTSLSRPAQASLALRPARLLNRLRGLCYEASTRPVAQPSRSSATRPIDYYLGGFFLHWLSVPFGAHSEIRDKPSTRQAADWQKSKPQRLPQGLHRVRDPGA
jgi:hypothetical protein